MAAHLYLTRLRRHALPDGVLNLSAGSAGPPPAFRPGRIAPRRPRLLATWHLDAGEHPVCHWSVDTGDPA